MLFLSTRLNEEPFMQLESWSRSLSIRKTNKSRNLVYGTNVSHRIKSSTQSAWQTWTPRLHSESHGQLFTEGLARQRHALFSQTNSPRVWFLKSECAVKHINSLLRLDVGGGGTLKSGQLQSSPAPSSQPGGESSQHTYRAHSKPTEPYRQGQGQTGRETN